MTIATREKRDARGSKLHRQQAAASHGFRGSAGLKGITLSWSVWAWEQRALCERILHRLMHPRLPSCVISYASTP